MAEQVARTAPRAAAPAACGAERLCSHGREGDLALGDDGVVAEQHLRTDGHGDVHERHDGDREVHGAAKGLAGSIQIVVVERQELEAFVSHENGRCAQHESSPAPIGNRAQPIRLEVAEADEGDADQHR